MAYSTETKLGITTPIGKLGIEINNECLAGIHFLPSETKLESPPSSLGKEVTHQLLAYFDNKLTSFDLPIQFSTTPFTQSVLDRLRSIPFGETLTYGNLAEEIVTSPRAIGNACRNNPLLIVVPCHRVVAKNHMGGFSGATSGKWIKIKAWLLEHEAH